MKISLGDLDHEALPGTIFQMPNSEVCFVRMPCHLDSRGQFSRTHDITYLHSADRRYKEITQVSVSINKNQGTFRGFHVQSAPSEEIKVVRVISGSMIDYIINLNEKAENYGSVMEISVNETDSWSILVPSGHAHGIFTTENNTSVIYGMNSDFVPDRDVSINFRDPIFNLTLPGEIICISDKDKNAPFLSEVLKSRRIGI